MGKYEYTINHPTSGEVEDFPTKREALAAAKKKDYTPVYIDVYDLELYDIVTDIRVDNPGKTVYA